MTEYLSEERTSDGETFHEIWFIPPADLGQPFRVTREEWNADYTERRIYGVEFATDKGAE